MKNQLLELRGLLIAAVHTIDRMYPKDIDKNNHFPKEAILEVCASYYGISVENIKIKTRGKWAARRQVMCAVLYDNMEGKSQDKIAELLGYKTHVIVCHHIKIMSDALNGESYGYDDQVRDYKEITKRLYVNED